MKLKSSLARKKVIVYDADVIIHFICGDRLLDLFNIYPNKSVILDKVYEELSRHHGTKKTIDNLTKFGIVEIVSFSGRLEVVKEYAHIMRYLNKGQGESACMAYCLHSRDIIASSNLKDTQQYCDLHEIEYLTTMDFLVEAYRNKTMEIEACEDFIAKLLSRNHKVPCKTFKDFLKDKGISMTA